MNFILQKNEIINSMVFFWATKGRLRAFLGAPHYQNQLWKVISVSTEALVARYFHKIRLSHINSGTTRSVDHKRGRYLFKTIDEFYRYDNRSKSGKRRRVAEVAVIGGVPDIRDMVVNIESVRGPDDVEKLP